MEKKMKVGVVGAGAISDIYLKNMTETFDNLEVVSICANHLDHAQKQAQKYGIRACTPDEMMADPQVEMIVNLTPADAHYGIIKNALEHGKHVYTEKVMTDDPKTAAELVALADEKGLYLGAAPDTFMGSAFQAARDIIDSGELGEIHSFVMSANRDNKILDSLFAFHRLPGSGAAYDYGVYYITALVSLLGSVQSVVSVVSCPYPKKINIIPGTPDFGQEMDTPNESQIAAVLMLKNGITGTMHMDCDTVMMDQAYFAIYGTEGILYLTDPNKFGGTVRLLKPSLNPLNQEPPKEIISYHGYSENSRGLGPSEMAKAIQEKRPNRASKEMAAHVLDVLNAILESSETKSFVEIDSTFEIPSALEQKTVPVSNLAHISFQMKKEEEMLHFYRDVLGMQELFTLNVQEFLITYLKLAEGQFIELSHDISHGAMKEIQNRDKMYGYHKMNYEVDDIKKIRDRMVECQVDLVQDIHPTLDGSLEIVVKDPDGNEVQFTQYGAAGEPLFTMTNPNHRVCSRVNYTTQVAFWVNDEQNMLPFYTRGLGMKKVATLSFADLAKTMEHAGNLTDEQLRGLRMMGNKPWIDYIEVAPHQYIELFYSAQKTLEESQDLQFSYGFQHICIEVSDIQESWKAVTANGITPDTEINLGADGAYQFWITDPDGNRLEFMEYGPDALQRKEV